MMKRLVGLALLLPMLALTACSTSVEDMLVGRWKMNRAVEWVSVVESDISEQHDMEGFSDVVLEFMEGDECLMTDRGDTVIYHWGLSEGNKLVLFREDWAEDYTIRVLNRERLVYSDFYTHYDSVSNTNTQYTYIYEYFRF